MAHEFPGNTERFRYRKEYENGMRVAQQDCAHSHTCTRARHKYAHKHTDTTIEREAERDIAPLIVLVKQALQEGDVYQAPSS